MNWTKELPTKPGFYAWRVVEGQREFACSAVIHGLADNIVVYLDNDLKTPEEMGGEWLPLIPGNVFEKEIEHAFDEGMDIGSSETYMKGYQSCVQLWNKSRAARVAQGLE